MRHIELITHSLSDIFQIFEDGDSVRVTTHCMYPTNTFVSVKIIGGTDSFIVSDNGNAFKELTSTGSNWYPTKLAISAFEKQHGITIKDSAVVSPLVPKESLGVAIALIANASKNLAAWLFDHAKIKKKYDFDSIVKQFLKSTFNVSINSESILGASNKPHKFENIILLSDNRKLIVDSVKHDTNSINARVVANMDIKSAGYDDLEQKLIYDDSDDWSHADLNLLQLGASVVPYSKAEQVFSRIAKAA